MNTDNSVKSRTNPDRASEKEKLNLEDDKFVEIGEPGNPPDTSSRAAVIAGQWAMPTTVALVLITCLSGIFLSEAAFTPVIGMVAPVVMALIMMVRNASLGKKETPTTKDRKNGCEGRSLDQKIKNQQVSEQARQFKMLQASTKEFFELIKEINTKMTQQMNKANASEFALGDSKVVINNSISKVESQSSTKTTGQ
ncbi:hypothetical protein [Thalassomonas haliotis]|uniref:Uncharacterized protein n=1 Tax=Thalassomonas haliotis TaxID=485448 RepID=A0ABY7VB10_9GAMM|nr:hypothetical protein [Thalassomonas haliotis]WDE10834.1 hypothetical protein H3N35_21695 [Thalassomonas haliotis]